MGIGKRLEELMKIRNLNTNELAKLIGVAPTTLYSMIKRDSNRVDIDLIIKIAHALGMTADELLSVDQPPVTIAAHFDGDDFTPEEQAEIENFKRFVKAKREH